MATNLDKAATVVLHRDGGLKLTKRFKDKDDFPLVSPSDWKRGSEESVIQLKEPELTAVPITVREVNPQPGDVTGRFYIDKNKTKCWVEMPCYGLVDPLAFYTDICKAMDDNILTWATEKGISHAEVARLLKIYSDISDLKTILHYDLARLMKTGSACIVGTNTLGIVRIPVDASTMADQVPLPRLITAQCDQIMSRYINGLTQALFGMDTSPFLRRLQSTSADDSHIAYLELRILVEGSIQIILDKQRRDFENDSTDTSFEVLLQNGLNCLIETFYDTHSKTAYSSLFQDFDKDAAAYHEKINKDFSAKTSGDDWKDAFFWLPPVQNIMGQKYSPKDVFK